MEVLRTAAKVSATGGSGCCRDDGAQEARISADKAADSKGAVTRQGGTCDMMIEDHAVRAFAMGRPS